uniref:Uncharacterized protein n=1 Tax=Arundo donax TaxID=35708 RepID=A0A0A9HFW7_ARUDO
MKLETFFSYQTGSGGACLWPKGLHVFKVGPSYNYLQALPLETSADCYLVPTLSHGSAALFMTMTN